ncbi:MAG: BON domain-containing protein [Akkermansiaceae bacterium]|nr:BON domain-containing protein [Armatimonadota bacterium]
MKRNNTFFAVAISVFALTGLTLTGCSEQTKDAASSTVEGAAQDTANNTAAAGRAVENTGEAVADGAKDAAVATGQAVEATGEAVKDGAKYTGEAVGGAVKGVGKETEDIAQIAKMTPLVKDALIKSKVDASTIDVDTSGEADTVILRGTVKSEAMKKMAMQSAMAAVKGSGESFKVKSELTVAP